MHNQNDLVIIVIQITILQKGTQKVGMFTKAVSIQSTIGEFVAVTHTNQVESDGSST